MTTSAHQFKQLREAVAGLPPAIENPDGKTSREGRRAFMRIVYDERKDPVMHECFFAFSKEQFQQGVKNNHLEDALAQGRIKSGGAGLYGTLEGLRRLHDDYLRIEVEQREALVAAGVTPQDAYLAEYDNYECMYHWDGDIDALRRTAFWFGINALRRIHRRGYNCISIDEVISQFSK